MQQPTPNVNLNDSERVVRREFAHKYDEVMIMLNETGKDTSVRAQLAALKLANGELKKLRYYVDLAKDDYRDVIAPAEYPGYMKKISPMSKLCDADKQRIIGEGWRQYSSWLYKEHLYIGWVNEK